MLDEGRGKSTNIQGHVDQPESSEIQLRNGKGCLQLHAIPGWMRRMKEDSECCCWIAVSAFKRTYWSTGILRNTIVGPCCSAVTREKLAPSRRSVCLVYPSNIELSRRILRRQVFALRNLQTQSADNTEGYTIYSVYRETRPVTIGSIKVFNEWEGISFWHLRIGSLQGFLIPPVGLPLPLWTVYHLGIYSTFTTVCRYVFTSEIPHPRLLQVYPSMQGSIASFHTTSSGPPRRLANYVEGGILWK